MKQQKPKLVNIDNFIGIWDFAYSTEFCQSVIDVFNNTHIVAKSRKEQEDVPPEVKSDVALDCIDSGIMNYDKSVIEYNELCLNDCNSFIQKEPIQMYDAMFHLIRKDYTAKYSMLPISTFTNGGIFKIQKTAKGEAYHTWHCEASAGRTNRVLAWSIYLNDVDPDDGGETSFLYYKLKCRPKVGRLMVWPAHFTHTHRGEVYWGNDNKYIMTGWLHYAMPPNPLAIPSES